MGLLNVCSPSTDNVVVKSGLLNLYRISTGIAVVKRGMTILYSPSTVLSVLKMCMGNIHRPSTSFAAIKINLLNNYRPSTSFGVVKTGISNIYRPLTGFLAAKLSCQILPSLSKLCGSQHGLVEPVQALYWLSSCHNVFTEHLCGSQTLYGGHTLVFNRLRGCQDKYNDLIQAMNRF